ncbi:MAG: hypothetical protein CO023_02245 [Flavobacteriales bacterium CG_4_9_14_0_2_um_filter_35_242]|nr:hypothetical protein [Zetaproteobacteria bacterium]NDK17853.1 hypothetical protein [Flavobacteriales bacterium]OIO10471.1 MAG: hypothetical protein AUJ53_06980 [Flavobacteriaceae bacterium CG1_02_35_72]PIR14394.1 MAG: hypothetical protein COV50_02990 [Flavobacteriales bacterium CG11_big_fil_rev_8_21_14_0_20_35_7]PIV19519.1 MAG: hypothetical protein COS42_00205 [Flavobacteriales bacterium CG03_land_8_20_14_0_80_35_15]PIX06952.1 MAG: hypothetical protein COZ76_06090 [Flavobacteriales bacteriu
MNSFKQLIITCFVLLSFSLVTQAQLHCGLVSFEPNTSESAMLTFDTPAKYQGGITINGATRLKIRVNNKNIVDPLCSWNLTMLIDNNPGAGTPISEWEKLILYGNGLGQNPLIQSLEIRIRNACSTSPNDGIYQTFTLNTDIIDIIAPLLPITPAGSCTNNVNGPGDYIGNYDEFHFDIDIRVIPKFAFNPGVFQLNLRFHLEENP